MGVDDPADGDDGEAAAHAAMMKSEASRQAFSSVRTIVSIGWIIYPLGFAVAYLCFFDQPAGDLSILAEGALNIIYNFADLVNKGAFGFAVYTAAVNDNDGSLLG